MRIEGPAEQADEQTLSAMAAAVALERGVSERTVWRWVKALRERGEPFPDAERGCSRCGGQLPAGSTAARVFCSPRCRVYSARERVRPPSEGSPGGSPSSLEAEARARAGSSAGSSVSP